MSLTNLRERLNGLNLSPVFGLVTKVEQGFLSANGLSPRIGDIVRITNENGNSMGMVTTLEANSFKITPFSFVEGTKVGDKVYLNTKGLQIPVGLELLGRVINPLGEPIDGKGELRAEGLMPIIRQPIAAMKRGMIDEVFSVGVKSIDGLLTCGKGQKLGIFAGSGVGKSTLMGMIVRGAQAKIKVIALIGERGREVPEFVEKNLGGDLTNTVLVVATSDDSPLMRKYGAFAAMSVAEYFKAKGEDVLFMMDSVTRFGRAQREIGLAAGEPPTRRGFPPSVFSTLPKLMERAGNSDKGSITALYTVLVEGDDMTEPIADETRSILDGHIILSRKLAAANHYPAIDVLASVSRVMNTIVSKEHKAAAQKLRQILAKYSEIELLVQLGEYKKGNDAEADFALSHIDAVNKFLKQGLDEKSSFEDTVSQLLKIVK